MMSQNPEAANAFWSAARHRFCEGTVPCCAQRIRTEYGTYSDKHSVSYARREISDAGQTIQAWRRPTNPHNNVSPHEIARIWHNPWLCAQTKVFQHMKAQRNNTKECKEPRRIAMVHRVWTVAWMAPAERTRYRTRRITETSADQGRSAGCQVCLPRAVLALGDFSNMAAALHCVFSLGTMPIEAAGSGTRLQRHSGHGQRLLVRDEGLASGGGRVAHGWAQNRPQGQSDMAFKLAVASGGLAFLGWVLCGQAAKQCQVRTAIFQTSELVQMQTMAPSCYMDGLAHCAPEHIRRPQQTGVSDL